jgi:hypothetical protein
MSSIADMQRILEAATEANVNFGSSNPQMFVKSFFDSLPKDDDIYPSDDLDNFSLSDDFSQIPSGSEFFTPNRSEKSGKISCEPPTPTLSLPDSFDGFCGTDGINYQDQLHTLRHIPHAIPNSCKRYFVVRNGYKFASNFVSCFVRCSTYQHSHIQELLSLETRLKRVIAEQNVEHETESRRLRKVHSTSEESHRLEVTGLEDRIQRLSTQLDTESTLRRLSEQRAGQFDKAFEDLKQTKTQVRSFHSQQGAFLTLIVLTARGTSSHCGAPAGGSEFIN